MKDGACASTSAGKSRSRRRRSRDLSIRASSLSQAPDALSGGNQQKVVAGKWLATEPAVLLLDEPTKGVDVGAKFEIHNSSAGTPPGGMACLIVSSDLPEVLALADRIS